MRAMLLHAPGQPLQLVDIPMPSARAGEVVAKVRACGIGLTLLWTKFDRFSGGKQPAKLPRIIGHEVAGDVVEVGAGVEGIAIGDRIAIYYYLTCGRCAACVRGQENMCENHAGYVGRQIHGGLAEYICVPERNVRPIPDAVGYVDAAVAADALATPLHVLRARAGVREGETVLVVGGGGGVGIHMIRLARALGARPFCVDIGEEKLRLARESGAEWAVDADERPFDEAVAEYTSGQGVDVVVEMVGTSSTVGPSLRSMGKFARLVLVGTYEPDTSLGLTVRSLSGEQSILTSRYCTRAEVSQALDLVARGIVEPVVTRRCSLAEADQVLDEIADKKIAGRAVAVL